MAARSQTFILSALLAQRKIVVVVLVHGPRGAAISAVSPARR